MELSHFFVNCRQYPLAVETFRDRAGTLGLCVLASDGSHRFFLNEQVRDAAKELKLVGQPIVCFDSRKLLEACPELALSRIIDMKLLHDGETSLFRIAKQALSEEKVQELQNCDKKLSIHLKACRTAKMDMTRNSILKLIPSDLVLTLTRIRCQVTFELYQKYSRENPEGLREYELSTWPFAKVLYRIERSGIHIDTLRVQEGLKDESNQAALRTFRSMDGLQEGGYVYSQFSPVGSRTGRIRIEGGFNSMTIPHGPAREAITSRWIQGSIVALDYNAIDYRCIVKSIQDEKFRSYYENCTDFHTRTAQFLFGDHVDPIRRDTVKQIAYVYIYGGSEETLSKKTGLSLEKLRVVLAKLDEKIRPIKEFREALSNRAWQDGFVTLPCGRKVKVDRTDHEGKILGLYAQSYSSVVFQEALMRLDSFLRNYSTKILFTVHDEVVLDVPFSETDKIPSFKEILENQEFVVKYKVGKNYSEATS